MFELSRIGIFTNYRSFGIFKLSRFQVSDSFANAEPWKFSDWYEVESSNLFSRKFTSLRIIPVVPKFLILPYLFDRQSEATHFRVYRDYAPSLVLVALSTRTRTKQEREDTKNSTASVFQRSLDCRLLITLMGNLEKCKQVCIKYFERDILRIFYIYYSM